jgi:predicted MFS family arabinose efflux permease
MYTVVAAMNTIKNTTRDMFGQEIVNARWRTGSQSIAVVSVALGWALAGISGGALIQASGFAALYFVSALCTLLAAGLIFGYQRVVGGRPVATSAVAPLAAEETPIQ